MVEDKNVGSGEELLLEGVGQKLRRAREGQWLFTNAYALPARGEHVIDGFAAFIETLGVPWPGPSWQMPLSNELRQWAEQQWDDPQQKMTIKASRAATVMVAVGILEIGMDRLGNGLLCWPRARPWFFGA